MRPHFRTAAQFQAALDADVVARSAHFCVHCLRAAPTAPPVGAPVGAVGVMVPKRWAKRAVTRNLIKRQIYAVCDAHWPVAAQDALLVRLRARFDPQVFVSARSDALKAAVRAELLAIMTRIRKAESQRVAP